MFSKVCTFHLIVGLNTIAQLNLPHCIKLYTVLKAVTNLWSNDRTVENLSVRQQEEILGGTLPMSVGTSIPLSSPQAVFPAAATGAYGGMYLNNSTFVGHPTAMFSMPFMFNEGVVQRLPVLQD